MSRRCAWCSGRRVSGRRCSPEFASSLFECLSGHGRPRLEERFLLFLKKKKQKDFDRSRGWRGTSNCDRTARLRITPLDTDEFAPLLAEIRTLCQATDHATPISDSR
jgi:hypothetical protein